MKDKVFIDTNIWKLKVDKGKREISLKLFENLVEKVEKLGSGLDRLLKKIRCTLRHFIPLSNLFPNLAHRFPFPHPLGLGL